MLPSRGLGERTYLHARFFEGGAAITSLVALSVVGVDSAWKISVVLFALALVFVWARFRARKGKEDAVHVGLATGWLVMLLCDDGFAGVGGTWVFYIPYSLQIRVMTRPGWSRWLWYSTIPAGLALANLTDWLPQLNRVVSSGNARWQIFVDFTGAFVWSFYVFRLIQALHERELVRRGHPL